MIAGGPWRTAHRFTTIGVPSALLYFLSLAIRIYLTAYNLIQTVGWTACFVSTVKYLAEPSQGTVWDHTVSFTLIHTHTQQVQANTKHFFFVFFLGIQGTLVTIFQFLAVLEIVHSMLGLVSSSVGTTAIQVFSRYTCHNNQACARD